MYAAVPCYNLAALHEAIKHDLPPTPDGIVAVWQVIAGNFTAPWCSSCYFTRIANTTPYLLVRVRVSHACMRL
jgi:fatty acid desaturase